MMAKATAKVEAAPKAASPTMALLNKAAEGAIAEVEPGNAKTEAKAEVKEKLSMEGVDPKSVDSEDMIVSTAFAIENIKEAGEAVALVRECRESGDFSDFKLGGALTVIFNKSWFGDKKTFREYVEGDLQIGYRKAMYLISNYKALVNAGIKWVDVSTLGWTKLTKLTPILNKDNVKEWAAKAKGMTVLQLEAEVASAVKAKMSGTELGGESGTAVGVKTKTFKLHPDQNETVDLAIKKGMEQMATQSPSHVLHMIATDYLANGLASQVAPKADLTDEAKLVEVFKMLGIEKSAELLDKAFGSEYVINIKPVEAGDEQAVAAD